MRKGEWQTSAHLESLPEGGFSATSREGKLLSVPEREPTSIFESLHENCHILGQHLQDKMKQRKMAPLFSVTEGTKTIALTVLCKSRES